MRPNAYNPLDREKGKIFKNGENKKQFVHLRGFNQ